MTKSTADVPESIKPHLMQIAERLWNGRAVVMVGAGFSKNASNAYPSWMQLGDVLYEKAHGKKPEPADKAYLSLLKVAEDVEAVIKRPALDDLLMQHIPNDTVDPSTLHETLLTLPWADILTTNYDTLLERAQRKVVNRRYSTVLDLNDLAYAEKPRIIKLHGSFPSHRPFVITEEDYRQYPQTRAPFVNTVRQALLENTLCLIGFSGDDPNFLHWIGWIRDQLGSENTQPIYLITIGSFSVAQQAVLAKRQIIVVDMALCNGVISSDHVSALTKFFSFMEKGDPYRLDWPSADYSSPKNFKLSLQELENRVASWQRQRQLYPGWVILPYAKRDSLFKSSQPWTKGNFSDEITTSINGIDIRFLFELCWRMERCLLPLFDNVSNEVEAVLEKYWPFVETQDIKCRACRGNEQFSHLDWPVIQEAWLGLACSLLRFYREEDKKSKWHQLRELLCSLNHYLTDEQKEFLQYQNYLFYLFQLDISKARDALINWRPGPSKPFWQNIRFTAAAELGLLQQLNLNGKDAGLEDGLLQALFETKIQGQHRGYKSFYQAESQEAYQMLFSKWIPESLHYLDEPPATPNEIVLMRVKFFKDWQTDDRASNQSRFQPISENIIKSESLVFSNAEEDWKDFLAKKDDIRKLEWDSLLREIRSHKREIEAKQRNKRWNELKAVCCDPWAELKFFELMLAKPAVKQQCVIEQSSFDLGRRNISHHYSGTHDEDALNAYAFLRFSEEIGLPFNVINTNFVKTTVMDVLPRVSKYSLAWAIFSLLRTGEPKVVDRLFSREAVFAMSVESCDELIQQFLKVLVQIEARLSAELLNRSTFEQRLAMLLPELISRLCCKSSLAKKIQVVELVACFYKSPIKISYGGVLNLSRRLFNSFSDAELNQLLPDILKIRRPIDLNARTKREFPAPLQIIEFSSQQKVELPDLGVLQPEITLQLRNLTSNDDELRDWAIATLIPLQQLGILNPEQTVQLNGGCWQLKNEYGLPKNNVFYQFTFLKYLPRDAEKDCLFKEFIDKQLVPLQPVGKVSATITGGLSGIVHEIIGAAQDDTFWTAQDARNLLIRLIHWWDADKHRLESERNAKSKMPDIWGGARAFHTRLQHISELFAVLIGPALNSRTSAKTKKELSRVLAEMRQEQLQTLEAQVACLHLISVAAESLLEQIVTALQSGKADNENDALKAILLIAQKQHTELWSQAEDLLSQFILWNRSKNLTQGLWVVIRLLKENQINLSPQLKLAALKRLQRLILETDYENGSLSIDFNHKIELRKVAMRLASAFAPYMQELDTALAGTIEHWRQISTSPEEFAEVRHAWTD